MDVVALVHGEDAQAEGCVHEPNFGLVGHVIEYHVEGVPFEVARVYHTTHEGVALGRALARGDGTEVAPAEVVDGFVELPAGHALPRSWNSMDYTSTGHSRRLRPPYNTGCWSY